MDAHPSDPTDAGRRRRAPRRPNDTPLGGLSGLIVDHGRRYAELVTTSLALLADYREATDKAHALETTLREQLHPSLFEMVVTFAEARVDQIDAAWRLSEAELERHLPGLAPAIALVWDHVVDSWVDAAGRCCVSGDQTTGSVSIWADRPPTGPSNIRRTVAPEGHHMTDARSQMSDEQRAACDAAYEAWVAKVHATEGAEPHGEPDAFTAGYQAGQAFVMTHRHDD